MSNYLLSLHVNFAARKSSLKNVSESGQPYCAEWPYAYQKYVGQCVGARLAAAKFGMQLLRDFLEEGNHVVENNGQI